MTVPHEKLKAAAIEACTAAGDVLAQYFGTPFEVREKPGAGLVTNADLQAEEAALGVLKREFPSMGVLAEESGESSGDGSESRWIIDPLDGTTNFVHGFPMFCVSIAAEWEGELVLGAIYHPILKELYLASKGQGAFVNDRKIEVSKAPKLEQALLTTGFTYRKEHWLKDEIRCFAQLSQQARAVRRPGSAALDLAYVARGTFDGFWERNLSPWDVAAGAVLVQEAGGKVTDFKGNDFDYRRPEILASNSILHDDLRKPL
jgi:myo-inositol-1(or 4)-monophosphatase